MVHEEFGAFRLAFEHVQVCIGPESLDPRGFHRLLFYIYMYTYTDTPAGEHLQDEDIQEVQHFLEFVPTREHADRISDLD